MGWFSRPSSPKPAKPPRWGFTANWDELVTLLREIAREYELEVTAEQLASGRVGVTGDALYEYWDLRPLGAACRDADPDAWPDLIRASLAETFGRPGTQPRVDLVDAVPPGARVVRDDLRPRLRAQLFGRDYFALVDRDAIACRPLGDAWLVLVQDLVGGESTVRHAELAAQGLDAASAFPLAIEQGAAASADAQLTTLALPGATCEIAVANSFYLASLMVFSHARLPAGTPCVVVALTWHHWLLATLDDTATPATLAAIADVATQLAAEVKVTAAEWIGTSLWWWPPGAEPEPFTLAALPPALAARLAR